MASRFMRPVMLEGLRAKPVLVAGAERGPLPILGPLRIRGNHLKCQPGDGGQTLGGVLPPEPSWVLLPETLDLPDQRFELLQEQRMSEHRPTVDDQRLNAPHGFRHRGLVTDSRSGTLRFQFW